MSETIYVEDYTAKSFVVRGDTQNYKDSIKAMGGKWNSRLTDKETGDKFGAWLFWSDKRKEIDRWVTKGCSAVDGNDTEKTPTYSYGNSGGSDRQAALTIKRLESKIDCLTRMVEQICAIHDIEVEVKVVEKTPPKPRRLMQQRPSRNAADDFEIEDDEPATKPKRLLNTRK
jgi:hypothetical protein